MSTDPTIARDSALSPLKKAYLALEAMQARVERAERARCEPIAIVGIGCRFPGGANDPESYWRLLRDGVDAIQEVPADRWDIDEFYDPDPNAPGAISSRWGGFVDGVDQFDPAFFGISPREAASMDPQQRLLLEVTWEALEHGAQPADQVRGSKTGVFVGISTADYAQLQLNNAGLSGLDAYYATGTAHSVASGRLSYVLDLQGPSVSVDTACSSSLVAVHLAVQSLRSGNCNMALAGGVNLMLSPENSVTLSRFQMLSPDGRCKTFDARADGFVRGEGCGMVVLKRLSDARADGDRILAVIRGAAVNQDGASSGLTAPNGPAQAAVLRAALADAGVQPAQIGYVEAHGTGTSLGDPIEVQALGEVMGEHRGVDNPLRIASVKTNIGHLEAVAGVAGLIKTVLILQHRQIPAHLHLQEANPHIAWTGLPLRIATELEAWPANGVDRRMAGVSAFGFSGTNAHVVLEEATAEASDASPAKPHSTYLVPIAGRSESSLRQAARDLTQRLADQPALELHDVAYTAGVGRTHATQQRLAIVATDTAALQASLSAVAAGETAAGVLHGMPVGARPKIAFVFPGQGAQRVGMGAELFESEPIFRAALEHCDAVLRRYLDVPLLAALYPDRFRDDRIGSTEAASALLRQTAYTQPALFALGYALAELWRSWGVEPTAVLGHSVGELVAACVAGVFDLDDGLRLVATRGRVLQALPTGGGMAAVRTGELRAARAIGPHAAEVAIAAVNAPDQIVLAGASAALERVLAELGAEGIAVTRLAVSHAFHSPLVEPALAELEQVAAEIRARPAQRARLIGGLAGRVWAHDEAPDAGYWRAHARNAVQFGAAVTAARDLGCDAFIELGPGPTLLAAGRANFDDDAAGSLAWLASLRTGQADRACMLHSLGSLYARGSDVRWSAVAQPGRPVALPTTPFERKRYWLPPIAPRSTDIASRSPGGHPLLGRRVPAAVPQTLFEATLRSGCLQLLDDHQVIGKSIVPAAGLIEMVLAAAHDRFGDATHEVADLTILAPLVVGEQPVTTQLVLEPTVNGAAALRIASAPVTPDAQAWTTHVTGTLRLAPDSTAPAALSLGDLQSRCPEPRDVNDHYAGLRAVGLELGGSLQGMCELRRVNGEALGRIKLPESERAATTMYQLHPVVLDTALQALAAALPDSGQGQSAYLPIGADRIRLFTRPGADVDLWAHATLHTGNSAAGETIRADVRVLDERGATVVEVIGLRLKRAGRDAIQRWQADRGADWLYELTWRTMPRVPKVAAELQRPRQDLAPFQEGLRHLDALSAAYAAQALGQLGWQPAVGHHLTTRALATQLGIVPNLTELLGRLLEIFTEDGLLQANHDRWQVVRWPDQLAWRARIETERTWLATHSPELSHEVAAAVRCGEGLADALCGKADVLQLLFPGGSIALAEQLYRESPVAQAHNQLVAEAIAGVLEGRPPHQPVRILEIGAGTGGTTSYVVARLPAENVEYVFTDVSPLFVSRGREKFADVPFMRYGVFDVEADPAAQGFSDGEFDVILAANILHATTDVQSTLQCIRQLLAPGGTLLVQEMVGRQRWVDISFGLTEGWWKFQDRELRPTYPLLTRRAWLDVLTAAGFDDLQTAPEPSADSVDTVLGDQAIVLARSSTSVTDPTAETDPGSWLVFADAGGTADELVRTLRARGASCDTIRVGSGPISSEPGEWRLEPTCSAQNVMTILTEVRVAGRDLRGVVHFWSLDAPDFADLTPTGLEHAQRQSCGSILATVQALAAQSGAVPPRLTLVTRGAQPAPGSPVTSPLQAIAWGMAASVALEHPELRTVCIDLDPSAEAAASVSALVNEILSPDGEDKIALRGASRHVARLVRSESLPVKVEPVARTLEIGRRGTLDNLSWEPLRRRAPDLGEVEIEVAASGLNFKDVLNALGLYPGDPGPLGGECAGTIVRVGPGVDGLHVGQKVLAVAAGCLRSFVTTSANLVAPVPDHLSFEAAATLPIAFITARFALRHLGRLRAGERVLIHSAAGGVGLAAVQVAQSVGAEVFATAGSDHKRDYLKKLGVAHVFDSRSLTFADEVMAATAGQGVDVVLNSLSGEFIPATLRVLAEGGRFLELGKRGLLTPAEIAQHGRDIEYFAIDWGETAREDPALVRGILVDVLTDIENGQLRSLPFETFSMNDAGAALRHMAQARHIGKLAVAHPTSGVPVRGDATYLITGGLSGLGLLFAEWLADHGARHLVLMGRRGMTDEAQTVLRRLDRLGVQTLIAQGDVSRAEDLASVLEDAARNLPPLKGIIHSAGALDDGALVHQDWSRFERVLAAKVQGAWHLHAATRDTPLDFFVLFSSIASVFGSAGQANHSAANAFLDALAHARRAVGLPAQSINWGGWSTVGAAVNRGVSARLEERGFGVLAPEATLSLFDALLGSSPPQVAVVPIDWSVLSQSRIAQRPLLSELTVRPARFPENASVSPTEPVEVNLAERLRSAPPNKRAQQARVWLQRQAGRVLSLEPSAVDTRIPLSELGLDSLMAVELRNLVQADLGMETSLPATLVFDYPTLERIAEFLIQEVLDLDEGTPELKAIAPPQVPASVTTASIDSIEDLSDAEVDRLFALRLGDHERTIAS